MTHVRTLYIGRGSFTLQLECGHVQHIDGWHRLPRPGSSYDYPDCRAQESEALAEQFTPVELGRLRFWQWMRLTGRAGA
jgi:hypothetical protein